ncbi:hypothetical protein KFV02_08650 [Desulfohalobiaceae bacterium Ax17]|jgi:glycosyltransferase involved in cell wall biosynthesis|uniref:hypothetical protein n=1 Tax=Desulfovulcanus ferrireducens TaxID=2831190 RepID=UPI00207BB9C4|nr:hypothetical protein [Desulfovulcanus ferrireducens]MBT8763997.1 hypothetical protein [Desulfovulcanus ferrireducens]
MRVALIHYHLQPGGVTRVINHILRSLQCSEINFVVLTGGPPQEDIDGKWRLIPGLQYEHCRPEISADRLVQEIEEAAYEALGGKPDLWHVHNPSLGKNLVLPCALHKLARKGERLLLHIHDFAEDGRPGNYQMMLRKLAEGDRDKLSSLLYPVATHIHYALLNSRDLNFLMQSGGDSRQLHLLPNPVGIENLEEGEQAGAGRVCSLLQGKKLWLYPTRGIRRKNMGEFLLWASLASQENIFATTLGPLNPVARRQFEKWKTLAHTLNLPVHFELALQYDFTSILQKAYCLLTTSISEGFGLAFLEPWLLNRPLFGRDIPEITSDFKKQGLTLPWLYKRLEVPVKWLGLDVIERKAREGLQKSFHAYGREPGPDDVERVLSVWVKDKNVDFGCLDEELQASVLHRIVNSPGEVMCLHPCSLPSFKDIQACLAIHRQILKEKYSLKRYGQQLEAIYNQVAASPVSSLSCLNGEELLDLFLAPERLMLLKVD